MKNLNNGMTKNLKMNNETYALRRKVISIIYDARKLTNLPRIEVRITEDHKKILGRARMNKNIIWVTKEAIKYKCLKAIVYHEILHAVFGIEHDDKCLLMGKTISNIDDKKSDELFIHWVNKSK